MLSCEREMMGQQQWILILAAFAEKFLQTEWVWEATWKLFIAECTWRATNWLIQKANVRYARKSLDHWRGTWKLITLANHTSVEPAKRLLTTKKNWERKHCTISTLKFEASISATIPMFYCRHQLRMHYEKKIFECRCGKSFASKNSLRAHEQIHDEKVITCEVCQKIFFDMCDLTAHLKISHLTARGCKFLLNDHLTT